MPALNQVTRIHIGTIGEDLPPSEFTDIINLNTLHPNFPVFDHLAKKDNEYYVFSTKARKRLGADGKINGSYNILYNQSTIFRKFKKAVELLKEHGYPVESLHYCFLVAPLSENCDCKYYWGEFCELKPECIYSNMIQGKNLNLAVPVKDVDLEKYKLFGLHSWSYVRDKYLTTSGEGE
jgi:hypothetical protein